MENTSKALLIAGAILLAILLISIGIYVYNNYGQLAIAKTSSTVNEMIITRFNNEYLMYEGTQKGTNVKNLLQCASANNLELYQSQATIQDCVCIRTKCNDILSKIKDAETKRALNGSRWYGVRYPNNINEIAGYISKSKKYNISFNYNSKGYIWEIWIDG